MHPHMARVGARTRDSKERHESCVLLALNATGTRAPCKCEDPDGIKVKGCKCLQQLLQSPPWKLRRSCCWSSCPASLPVFGLSLLCSSCPLHPASCLSFSPVANSYVSHSSFSLSPNVSHIRSTDVYSNSRYFLQHPGSAFYRVI